MKFNLLRGFSGVLLLTLLLTASAFAQEEGVPRVVDEVIAQVNDQVITLSMLRREMREATEALKQQGQPAAQAEAEVAKRQNEIVVALVNEQLILQKGKELGLSEDVERLVNQRLLEIAKSEGIKTIEQLEQAMRQQGLDPAAVRQTMRTEAMKQQVLSSEVDRRVYLGLTEAEVKTYYEANKDKFRKPETVTLSEIFLSTVGKPEAEVLARTQKLLAQLRAGGDFVALAKAQSEREDQTGKRTAPENGGRVGTFPIPDMNKLITDAIQNVKVGGVSEPVKTDTGYMLLRVDERVPAGAPTFEETRVRETLTYERAPKERENYLRQLRREAYIEVAPNYRDTILPLLKLDADKQDAVKTASAAAPAPAKKDDKKKKP